MSDPLTAGGEYPVPGRPMLAARFLPILPDPAPGQDLLRVARTVACGPHQPPPGPGVRP
jgi:hypothetical protein